MPMTCPNCNINLWGQVGSKEETAKGISYKVCTNSYCNHRVKVRWDKDDNKLYLMH